MSERLGRGEPFDAESALVDGELGIAGHGRNAVIGRTEPDTALESAVRAVGRGVRRGGSESGHWIQGSKAWSNSRYGRSELVSTLSCKKRTTHPPNSHIRHKK